MLRDEPFVPMEDDFNEWKENVVYNLRRLYRDVCVYYEMLGLFNLLAEFKAELSPVMQDDGSLVEQYKSEEDEPYFIQPLVVLTRIQSFLIPFNAFSKNAKKNNELETVINILQSASQIIKRTKIKPLTETAISKEVRWVLDFYFNDTKSVNTRFIKKHKVYYSDLVIPSLETAVEFKLVKQKKVIDVYLDQLIEDATNYTNDPSYTNFIAVLCLDNSTIVEKSVRFAWHERKFPPNWKLILVYV